MFHQTDPKATKPIETKLGWNQVLATVGAPTKSTCRIDVRHSLAKATDSSMAMGQNPGFPQRTSQSNH